MGNPQEMRTSRECVDREDVRRDNVGAHQENRHIPGPVVVAPGSSSIGGTPPDRIRVSSDRSDRARSGHCPGECYLRRLKIRGDNLFSYSRDFLQARVHAARICPNSKTSTNCLYRPAMSATARSRVVFFVRKSMSASHASQKTVRPTAKPIKPGT